MKITFSPLIASASGRAADAVAANWKGRGYIRKHVIPHNPKTAAQIAIRESLARCVTLWRSLGTEVKAWLDAYAIDYRMAGYNTFVSKNRALEQTPAALAVVPANPHVVAPAALTADVAVAEIITVTWTDAVVTDFTKMLLLLRRNDLAVFEGETLLIDASAETHDFTALTTGKTYDTYGAYFNPTKNIFGTTACDFGKEVT